MKILDLENLESPDGTVANFQGFEHGANVSFFVVHFGHGQGPRKHRHPYEETFILLKGEIDLVLDGTTQSVVSRKIVVIPAGTWHGFKVRSAEPVQMVNIHPASKMITEWA